MNVGCNSHPQPDSDAEKALGSSTTSNSNSELIKLILDNELETSLVYIIIDI